MAAAERLLDRIRHWASGGARAFTEAQREEMLQHSIQQHLSELLSTRKGSAQIDPDLGLQNNLELLSLGDSQAFADDIIRQIEKYEPRFLKPQVQITGIDHSRMQLDCALSGQLEGSRSAIRFMVSIHAGLGKVLVEL